VRIADSELAAWISPRTGKEGDAWPSQRTLHAGWAISVGVTMDEIAGLIRRE
jgi:hypothetical protein